MQAFLSSFTPKPFLQSSCNKQSFLSSSSTKATQIHILTIVSCKTKHTKYITFETSPESSPSDTRNNISSSSTTITSSTSSTSSTYFNPFDLFQQIFLPTNWSSTVPSQYLDWVRWHIGRHIFRNAYYVLGTTSLLTTLGLGTTNTIALGTTLKWVLKDGLGMTTKLFLSAKLAPVVDKDPKYCRFIGDSLMALSVAIEIFSITNPSYFLFYASMAALLREAASALSGPSYRVFLDSFAISSNIGDVSSRGEAQVVLGNLIGLAIGVVSTSWLGHLSIPDRLLPTLSIYTILASAHLSCTYQAVSSVQLKTLNWQRLNLILDTFIKKQTVLSVQDINKMEPFVYIVKPSPKSNNIQIGIPLPTKIENEYILDRKNKRYVLNYKHGQVNIALREDVQVLDIIQAVAQAKYLQFCIDEDKEMSTVMEECNNWMDTKMELLMKGLKEEGWSTSKLLIVSGHSRYRFFVEN